MGVTSFTVKMENSPLYCYFVNKPGYARWSIMSSNVAALDANNILFIQEGVIDLSEAVKMLHKFNNLKAFL